ncbi:MAG TPA: tetraacyldisaccharide 4'-kinase [Isosphaeraceae bacterium]|jgi:tetraacyldisaccharide 4'-kinase|nr:tetraacyldisaccharide 4'-kinase [Isosphaeraceae bacterium]
MFDESDFLRLIRGETRGPLATLARAGLGAAGGAYRLAVAGRNLAFNRGWAAAVRAEVPVVSVGNLTLGGTGKTPMVEWVARWYQSRGVRVALLSRGYGQRGRMNDEGLVLEENLPEVPHLQGPDRASLARVAVEELASQVLVLDDGFQHRRLARDLDLVLLDGLDPFGAGRVFPRGLLREPVSSLRRAGLVVLARADLLAPAERLRIRHEAERRAGPLQWAEARHAPLAVVDAEGQATPLERLDGARVAAFCGIGNPVAFRSTLEHLGAAVAGFKAFPDHHVYRATDLSELASWARSLDADLALTTQKDYVKLRTSTLGSVPLLALKIAMELLAGATQVEQALAELLPAGGGKDSR